MWRRLAEVGYYPGQDPAPANGTAGGGDATAGESRPGEGTAKPTAAAGGGGGNAAEVSQRLSRLALLRYQQVRCCGFSAFTDRSRNSSMLTHVWLWVSGYWSVRSGYWSVRLASEVGCLADLLIDSLGV